MSRPASSGASRPVNKQIAMLSRASHPQCEWSDRRMIRLPRASLLPFFETATRMSPPISNSSTWRSWWIMLKVVSLKSLNKVEVFCRRNFSYDPWFKCYSFKKVMLSKKMKKIRFLKWTQEFLLCQSTKVLFTVKVVRNTFPKVSEKSHNLNCIFHSCFFVNFQFC